MALVRDSDMTYCVSYNLFCFQHVAVFILRGKTVTPLTYSHIWLLQWWYNKNSHIVKPIDRLTDSAIGAGGGNEMMREKEDDGKFLRRNGLKCWQDGTGEGTDWQCYSCATSWHAPFFFSSTHLFRRITHRDGWTGGERKLEEEGREERRSIITTCDNWIQTTFPWLLFS